MKLLYCPDCGDIFNLGYDEKTCHCGATKGKYVDYLNAVYSGGIRLGISNPSFKEALQHIPASGDGKMFTAFVIPHKCATFKAVKE